MGRNPYARTQDRLNALADRLEAHRPKVYDGPRVADLPHAEILLHEAAVLAAAEGIPVDAATQRRLTLAARRIYALAFLPADRQPEAFEGLARLEDELGETYPEYWEAAGGRPTRYRLGDPAYREVCRRRATERQQRRQAGAA